MSEQRDGVVTSVSDVRVGQIRSGAVSLEWDVCERDVEETVSNKLEWEAEDRELEAVVWELGTDG